jgi:hypothetical protein
MSRSPTRALLMTAVVFAAVSLVSWVVWLGIQNVSIR